MCKEHIVCRRRDSSPLFRSTTVELSRCCLVFFEHLHPMQVGTALRCFLCWLLKELETLEAPHWLHMTSAPYFQPSPVRLRLRRDVRYATCSVSTSVGATRPKYRTDGPIEGWDECLQTRKKDSVEAHGRRCPCTERSTDVIFSHHAAFLHLTSSFCPSLP